MKQSSLTNGYPRNLICDVFGAGQDDLPSDIGDSVEHLLETRMQARDAFILILRYLKGMSVREIAAYYGMKNRRIERIIRQSLKRLRTPDYSAYLRAEHSDLQPRASEGIAS